MPSDGVKSYIKQVAGGMKQTLLFNRIIIYQQNPLPENIDLDIVITDLEERIPRFLCNDLDSIFIGQFSFLKEKDLEAVYESGAIYITNEQENKEDFLADIIHEIGHCVEEVYPLDIYGDKNIENEFLAKRKTLAEILNSHGYDKYGYDVYTQIEYSAEFDSYLYQEVGYDLLNTLTEGLFISSYGATSLREYFGNAFEEFYSADAYNVKAISPAVYNKIIDIQNYQ